MRKLELTIAGVGANCRVKFDGEDARARSFTIDSSYDDVTTVKLDLLAVDWEPFTVSGLFIPDDDPDYEAICEVLRSIEFRTTILKQKRANDARRAELEVAHRCENDDTDRDVTVMGDTHRRWVERDASEV